MNTSRNWARARRDASAAVETLGDAATILGSGLVANAAEGLDEARTALARAIEPTRRTRRWPWLLALAAMTALSAWGWSLVLRREQPVDPGTPVSTTAPTEDALFGKPVGKSPTTRTER